MITTTADSTLAGRTTGESAPLTGFRAFYARYFFVAMACAFIVITALGFVPEMVMIHQQHIPLHWFTHVHGAIMTGWLLLFLAQAWLAAKGHLKYHRQLGILSAVWAAVVWITMGIVVISALIRDNPPEESRQFATVALSLVAMVMFGLFFTWGIRSRKNPASHKRLLLLAMVPLITSGIDRLGFLPGLQGPYFIRFIYLDLLLIPFVLYDFVTLRRIHQLTMVGIPCLLLSQAVVSFAAVSPAWYRFVYTALTPYVERLPEVTLSDAQSDPLLGDYGGKDWHMTVGRDGGKLYLQLPNLPKWNLGATSETELFLKIGPWKLTFVKDAQGKVTKVINTQPDVTWEKERLK